VANREVAQATGTQSPNQPDPIGNLLRDDSKSQPDPIGDLLAAETKSGTRSTAPATDVPCNDLYKKPQDAADLSLKVFNECFYGQTDKTGRSRELIVPTSRTLEGMNKDAVVTRESITTLGKTGDSRMLNIYMNNKDSILQVTSENPGESPSKGTGFFVSKDGLFATDYHCIENLKPDANGELTLTMPDGTKRAAKVVALDKGADLALLKIDRNPGEEFKPLPLGNSTEFQAGERLAAIGKAWGNDLTVLNPARFRGMVNQANIPFDVQPPYVNQNRTLMVTDSLVAKGNSGGPALRLDGTVAGLIVYSNISNKMYFTPVERLKELIAKYEKSKI